MPVLSLIQIYQNPPSEQDLEADLQGEIVHVTLTKSPQRFGFTIMGGDHPGHLLLIKTIVPGSIADQDGRLKVGDVLVRINRISVITYSYREVVNLFQSLTMGSEVEIECRRGYPLTEPGMVTVNIIKGPLGFGFALSELCQSCYRTCV